MRQQIRFCSRWYSDEMFFPCHAPFPLLEGLSLCCRNWPSRASPPQSVADHLSLLILTFLVYDCKTLGAAQVIKFYAIEPPDPADQTKCSCIFSTLHALNGF